jgi:hypothetical protein
MTGREPIRVVCAWCGAELAPGVDPPSHGICDRCAAAFRAELVYAAAELVDGDAIAGPRSATVSA